MGAYGPSVMDTLAALRERRHPAPRPWPRRPAGPAVRHPPLLEDDPDITLELDPPPEPRFAPAPSLGREPGVVAPRGPTPFVAPAPSAPVAAAAPSRVATPAPSPAGAPKAAPARPPLPPLELPGSSPPSPAASLPEPEPAQAPPAARALLLAGLALVALLALGTLWWIEWRPAAVTTAAAAAAAPPVAPAVTAPAVAHPDEAATTGGALVSSTADPASTPAAADTDAPPAEQPTTASTPAPTLTPSAARRECMAQVETARLFLQIAHDSENFSYYAHATRPEIDRIVATRPVGPKTVAGIADHMWERRDSPERGSDWWSSQFSRCTQARVSGQWYVVRG